MPRISIFYAKRTQTENSKHIEENKPQENQMFQYTDDNSKCVVLNSVYYSITGTQLSSHHQFHQQGARVHVTDNSA